MAILGVGGNCFDLVGAAYCVPFFAMVCCVVAPRQSISTVVGIAESGIVKLKSFSEGGIIRSDG